MKPPLRESAFNRPLREPAMKPPLREPPMKPPLREPAMTPPLREPAMKPPLREPAINRPLRVIAATFALLGSVATLAWLAGFAWFVHDALRPAPLPPHADGIVALTGGAGRIATALQLLQQNRARLLLISGVAPSTEFSELFHGTGIDPAAMSGRITVGRAATDTLGNADEAADWARAHALRSLIVVTASYHMKRALIEIGRTLPDMVLFPAPVLPPALRGAAGLSTMRLLADEYTKFLAAELGLTRLQRARDMDPPDESGSEKDGRDAGGRTEGLQPQNARAKSAG